MARRFWGWWITLDAATADILVIDDPHREITRVLSVGRHSGGTPTIANDRRFQSADIAQTRDATGADAVIIGSGDREAWGTVSNRLYVYKDRNTAVGAPQPSVGPDLEDITTSCVVETSCTLAPTFPMAGICSSRLPAGKISPCADDRRQGVFHYIADCIRYVLSAKVQADCAVSLQNGSAQLDFDGSNDITSNDGTTTVVPERADNWVVEGSRSGCSLGWRKGLAQGQEVGENIVDTGGQTSFKTYWHESYQ